MIELSKLIRQLEKELADMEWNGYDASAIRDKLDMLRYKVSIGETADWDF